MPLIFRCDVCGTEHDLPSDGGFDPKEVSQNCDWCGQDGCFSCLQDADNGERICDMCFEDAEHEGDTSNSEEDTEADGE